MLLSRVARVAAALLVSAVAVLGLPRPALAVDKYVGLTAGINAQALALGTTGKDVPVYYGAYSVGGATLPDTVTVKVDTGAAKDVVTAKLADPKPAGCSQSDAVVTCTKKGDKRSDIEGDFLLVFTAAQGAKIGDRATITFTLSAPGQETKTLTQDLTIADSGPDLKARSFTRSTNPGGTVTFNPAFVNKGDRRGELLLFELYAEPFAEFTDKFSNCRYAPQPSRAVAVCVFKDINLEPGETITTTSALSVKAKADIPNRTFVSYNGSTYSSNSLPNGPWAQWPLGTGPALAWERTPAPAARDTALDVDSGDNQGNLLITTSTNPSDVVANGAKVTGKVGDTVTVKLGLTNKGPALINGISDSETSNPEDPYNAAFVAKFPTGVEVTKIENPAGDGHSCRGKVGDKYDDEANKVGRSEYRCMRWKIGVNETHTVTFTVKITAAVTAAGSIVARGGAQDPNTANNTAKIEFTGQDGLPITGPNAALTATVGALMVAAGFVLVFVGRRRDDDEDAATA